MKEISRQTYNIFRYKISRKSVRWESGFSKRTDRRMCRYDAADGRFSQTALRARPTRAGSGPRQVHNETQTVGRPEFAGVIVPVVSLPLRFSLGDRLKEKFSPATTLEMQRFIRCGYEELTTKS